MEVIANFFMNMFPIHMYFSVQLLIAEGLFLIGERKRGHAFLRIFFATIFYLLISFFHPALGDKFVRVLCIFAWSIVYLCFCLRCPFKRCLFIALASYAVQNLAYNVGDFVTKVFRPDIDFWFYVITAACFIVVYVVAYFVAIRQFSKEKEFYVKDIWCLLLAIATIAVVYSKNVLRFWGILTDLQLLILFTIISCVLTLVVQFGAIRQGKIEEQNHIIEQLLAAEKKRLDSIQENVDIINMKCHDLRYHIRQYRADNVADEHKQFFEEIEKSINIYDSIALTGNRALDVVLSEKLLFCNGNHIKVSYIVDESVLVGMDVSDIYSLFGNAIDNAVESVLKAEEDKRIISISVKRKGGCGQIVISNYCAIPPKLEDGLPVSEKDTNLHGFGTRSIRYIVEKYNGSFLVDVKNELFTLSILLPESEKGTTE